MVGIRFISSGAADTPHGSVKPAGIAGLSGLLQAMTVVACVLLVSSPAAEACTTFLVGGGDALRVGKSYDWGLEQGLVFFNKAGVEKTALVLGAGDRPVEWTSRHASLTFNQYGREMPNGGMNTAGLVVEIMWLKTADDAPADGRPMVNEMQWIQYQLDRYATVADVVAHAQDVRITRVHARVHYLVCDRTAACAAIEHVDGKLRVTHGESLIVPVLTNHTALQSIGHLRAFEGFGGRATPPGDRGSLSRFVRAASAARAPPREGEAPTDRAFEILESVRSGDYTKWQIVYDPTSLRVWYRTLGQPRIKRVDMARLHRSCGTPVRMLDMAAEGAGDVTDRMAVYSDEANSALVRRGLADIGLPSAVATLLSFYPRTQRCAAP